MNTKEQDQVEEFKTMPVQGAHPEEMPSPVHPGPEKGQGSSNSNSTAQAGTGSQG